MDKREMTSRMHAGVRELARAMKSGQDISPEYFYEIIGAVSALAEMYDVEL